MDTNSPSDRPRRSRARIAGYVLVAAVATASVAAVYWRVHSAHAAAPSAEATGDFAGPAGFAGLIRKVSPAVVRITMSEVVKTSMDMPDELKNTPLGRLFEQFGGPEQARRVNGLGSGFIIDPSGYIVTNDHVAGKAQSLKVTLADGRQFKARLLGEDRLTDIALLKIDGGGKLPFVSFGESNDVHVGDWVVAMGNPYGLGGTATAGIVSARGRDLGSGPYDDFIQTDASINPGNSGGPLFDLSGHVVGVNSVIFTPNGGNVGIGFAISGDIASKVAHQLQTRGHVERGWLGVSVQSITPELAQVLGLAGPKGALVTEVRPGSPAAKSGLSVGDVIVRLGSKSVDTPHDLATMTADAVPGSTVEIWINRGGQTRELHAQIGQMRNKAEAPAAAAGKAEPAMLGMSVASLDKATREELGIVPGIHGVVVATVAPTGIAADHGVKPGDVIVAVNRTPVASPAEAKKALRQASSAHGGMAVLQIMRDANNLFIALPVTA